MATMTMSQSATMDTSLTPRGATNDSFRSKKDCLERLQNDIPSFPDELYSIASKCEVSSQKSQTRTPIVDVGRDRTTSQFGDRNPYLPFLLPTSIPKSEVPCTTSSTVPDETFPATGQSCASTNGASDVSSSSNLDGTSRTSCVSTIASLRRGSIEQGDLGLSLQAPTREAPKPPAIDLSAGQLGPSEKTRSATFKVAQIETTSATGLAPTTGYQVIKFDLRCYVSTDMPKPTEASMLWDDSYRSLLKEVLQYSATAKDDNESAMALEFYMAGTSPKSLKPSVLVTCCSSKKKKVLKSRLSELRWLKESGWGYFVRVDRSFGYRTLSFHFSSGEPFWRESGGVLPNIETRRPNDSTTFCGISARINSVPGQTQNDELEAIRFTIGGLVRINGQSGFLVAGHPFKPSPAMKQSSSSSTASSDTDDSDFDPSVVRDPQTVEPYTKGSSIGEMKAILKSVPSLPARDISINEVHDLQFRRLEHQGIMSSFDSPFIKFTMRFISPGICETDWAFIVASSKVTLPSNTIWVPGAPNPTPINGIFPTTELLSGPVWIAAGSGLRRGELDATRTSIFLGGRFHEVRMITLDRCLAYGDSGSWVVRGGLLCGMIVAGRDSLPWAYMICIEEIFSDIKASIGSDAWVGLPSGFQPQTQPLLEERPPDRNDNIIAPLAPEPHLAQDNEKVIGGQAPHIPSDAEIYLRGYRLWILIFTLMLSMFLDDSGTGTSLPRITDHFDSLDDIGWYASAFFVAKAAVHVPFMAFYGRFPAKWIFTGSILIFEIGSLLSALSRSSVMFILGRSVSGIGSSGMSMGAAFIGFTLAPSRSTVWSLLLIAGQMSSVLKPILSGLLVDKVTWRWTYYIDMPIGAVVLVLVLLYAKPAPGSGGHWAESPLEVTGLIFGLASLVSLLLSLNWAGRKYSFKEAQVSILFIFPGAFMALFATFMWRKKGISLWRNSVSESMILKCLTLWLTIGTFWWTVLSIMGYYLSIWFQAIKDVSALESGIMSMALTLGALVGSLLSGVLSWRLKRYDVNNHMNLMLAASFLAITGSVLMTLFTAQSAKSLWIGFQVMLGIGIGMSIYMPASPFAAVLIRSEHKLNAYLTIVFIDALSASIFHSVAQSIFVNTLHSGLKGRMPGFDAQVLMHTGVTTFAPTFPAEQRSLALQAYNAALINVFHLGTGLSSFAIFGYSFWVLRRIYRRRRVQSTSSNRPLRPPQSSALVTEQGLDRSSNLKTGRSSETWRQAI